ncbi:MAG: SpoIID/LytB domain-containing protein, partial [bacterium]|nr:SpoIID/LytB domain-containing protein [bacterium]
KINAPKDKLDNAKKNLNEKVFRKGVKSAVNTVAPGAGVAAEKLLDVGKGKEAVDAARNASNPVSGLRAGAEKLVKVAVQQQVVKKALVTIIPVIVSLIIVAIIIIGPISKFADAFSFFSNGSFGDVSELDKDYQSFYENIEKYGGTNKQMVVAVLTAYKDNDEYIDEEANNSFVDSCTDDEIENGDCFPEVEDNITKFSKSKMKRYIKRVANQIDKSTNGIDEGDYEDRSTGSDFFWWLYDDFVDDYYSEYLNKSSDYYLEKKKEIIEYIYLLYKDLKDQGFQISNVSYLCTNGVTVIGSGTYDLEDYVAGVVTNEAYTSEGIEALKAQAIAARTFVLYHTNSCTKPIDNSTNAQTFNKNFNENALKATKETAGMVLTYEGEIFSAQYDSFCYDDSDCPDSKLNANGTYTVIYTRLPKEEKHTITLSDSTQLGRILRKSGHARGMSQLLSYEMAKNGSTSDQILKYFYSDGVEISKMGFSSGDFIQLGSKGIYSASIFPIDSELKNVHLTQGYRYNNGTFHGAIDLFCTASNAASQDFRTKKNFCTSIKIVSAHSGVVTHLVNNQNCAKSTYYNNDKDLPVYSSCVGNGVDIKITDSNDPYYGYTFRYWHFNKIDENIKIGSKVEMGQFLGYMGSTGSSTGWHLHFEIRNRNDQKLNQNDNILQFVDKYGLGNSGILATNEGVKY